MVSRQAEEKGHNGPGRVAAAAASLMSTQRFGGSPTSTFTGPSKPPPPPARKTSINPATDDGNSPPLPSNKPPPVQRKESTTGSLSSARVRDFKHSPHFLANRATDTRQRCGHDLRQGVLHLHQEFFQELEPTVGYPIVLYTSPTFRAAEETVRPTPCETSYFGFFPKFHHFNAYATCSPSSPSAQEGRTCWRMGGGFV